MRRQDFARYAVLRFATCYGVTKSSGGSIADIRRLRVATYLWRCVSSALFRQQRYIVQAINAGKLSAR